MTLVTWLLLTAAVCYGFARLARLPSVPILIAGGVILSLVSDVTRSASLATLYELSVTFLVFSVGSALSLVSLRRYWRAAVYIVLAEFLILGLLGVVGFLSRGWLPALYIGVAVAASSTLVGVSLLQQRAQVFQPFGRVLVIVLVLQDLLVIWLVGGVEGAAQGWVGAARGVGNALLLTAAAWLVSRYLAPRVLSYADDEESVLLIVLALLCIFAGASHALGLPPFVGAFLAGAALSEFPVSGMIRGSLYSLSDFFHALFYVSLGALISAPDPVILLEALGLAIAILVITPLVVLVAGELAGMTARSALEVGMLLSQTSEMSIVLIMHGVAAGVLVASDASLIVLVSAVTMSTTQWLSRDRVLWKLLRWHPFLGRPAQEPVRDHVLVLGGGDTGRQLARDISAAGRTVVVVDDDPAIVSELQHEGLRAIRGDGSDYRVLEQAGLASAGAVISTLRRGQDHRAFLKRRSDVTAVVRVFETEEACELEKKGATTVLYSHAAALPLIEWILTTAEIRASQDGVQERSRNPLDTRAN